MLDLRYVVEHLTEVRAALARRGPDAGRSLEPIAALAERRTAVIARLQALREEKNEANAAMAKLDKQSDAFKERREALKRISDESKELEAEQREVEMALDNVMLMLPNLPAPNVPDGRSSDDNVEVRRVGKPPVFDFKPREHDELAVALGIVDFERGTKLSGARFSVLKGAGARLERALMTFMLELHTSQHGYTEVWPPVLVTDESLRATGHLPKFEADLFRIAPDWQNHIAPETKKQVAHRELYLIPTAEVPLTNLHRNEILDSMPVKYCAYTPCFRSEAGSYGKDTKGLIRQHQFDKVELVRFERPEVAEAALEELTLHAEEVLKRLELHYRVVELCAGDLSNGARRCYDIEVFLPGQDAFREISSCSWFGDFQARRAQIRFRPKAGDKPVIAHTLNGSGLAIGRTLVAILEQYQQADGSVRVPEVLVPYLGGLKVIRA
ncbi:MAG TPA: serine--tRNA ligase [Polyangiales bacterium]|nr:serine--tRNA ligase [Polyangiales bacterium]